MSEKMKRGEFARLCHTTKDTLRHYEEIGLLTPASTAENGYKEYLSTQSIDFMIISALKDAGCFLAEIKHFQAGNKEVLRDVMSECLKKLTDQIDDLQRKKNLLASSIARIDELATWRKDSSLVSGSWRIQDCEQACYIETQLPLHSSLESVFATIADHASYCANIKCDLLAETQQASYRISKKSFETRNYASGFFLCTPILHAVDCDRMHTRPAGIYLQQLNALPLETATRNGETNSKDNSVFETYDALKDLAEQEGLTIIGDVYDAELSLGTIDDTDLLWKETSVLVEPITTLQE